MISCPVCFGVCYHYPEHNLSKCWDCRHIFQTDLNVTVSYDADYAHAYDVLPVREMSELRWNFIQSVLHLPPQSKILDIGYGNGAFLKRAQLDDMQIFGIDVHNEDFGIPRVDFHSPQKYDLVCFFDSLEHFPNFDALVLFLSTKNVIVSLPNTPDFVLETPNLWKHYKPGEHLHYFSHESLYELLYQMGHKEVIIEGYPEDKIRGKLNINDIVYDNIKTVIFGKKEQ